jgi:signal peptidase II
MRSYLKYFLLTLLVIAIDQAIKLAVHFYMTPGFIGQKNIIGDFFKLHYVTNPGMAFGITFDIAYGKLLLTLFRIVAMVGIAWYIINMQRKGAHKGFLWSLALILGGAIGNLIDSVFYGKFLGNAPYGTTNPWFHGQVIDMFFFDFWEGMIPSWVPFWGGSWYSTPIFNFADAAIFVGVCIILIWQKKFFIEPESPKQTSLQSAENEEIDASIGNLDSPIANEDKSSN